MFKNLWNTLRRVLKRTHPPAQKLNKVMPEDLDALAGEFSHILAYE